MCGLAGYWRQDRESADSAIVARMLDRQQARGPSDRGVWSGQGLALGLDRLSILDLSERGHQPFATARGSSVIVYNGEVYNWQALRRDLEAEGVVFSSHCDTEVVLYALDRWGPEIAIPRFNGMFALAWFDRESDSLWLARDRVGIKPLYLYRSGALTAFASEAKSLFAHPDIPLRPDIHSLVTQVYLQRLAGDWTAFDGVRSIAPGSMIHITRSGHTTRTWFDVERDVDVDRILSSDVAPFENQVSTMKSLLEESVALHLKSDAPLAVMCSGGLDSSLTTAIARQHRPDLVAFVAEVEGAPVAEAEKAQQVADHLGVKLRRIQISDEDYPGLWCRAARHNDEPIFFYQNPLTLRVAQAVRDEGFRVLVTGEGADELFGGYPWQMNARRMWSFRRWHARLLPSLKPLNTLFQKVASLAPINLQALAEEPFQYRSNWLRAPPEAELVIDAGMRRRRARALFKKLAPVSDLGERAFLTRGFDDIYHHLPVLLTSNDKMTMANSVEMRVPFLESALIDFGMHLGASAKIIKNSGKRIVKAAAEDLLPDNIIHARKIGFATPNTFWSGYDRLLRDGIIADLFKWGSADMARMEAVLRQHPPIAQKLVGMELWAQSHLTNITTEQLEEKLRSVRRRRP